MLTATASRQEKRKWLFDPFEWALTAGFSGLPMVALMAYDGRSSGAIILALSLISLIETGLVAWGVIRLAKATDPR